MAIRVAPRTQGPLAVLLYLHGARAPGLTVKQLSHQYVPSTWCQTPQ